MTIINLSQLNNSPKFWDWLEPNISLIMNDVAEKIGAASSDDILSFNIEDFREDITLVRDSLNFVDAPSLLSIATAICETEDKETFIQKVLEFNYTLDTFLYKTSYSSAKALGQIVEDDMQNFCISLDTILHTSEGITPEALIDLKNIIERNIDTASAFSLVHFKELLIDAKRLLEKNIHSLPTEESERKDALLNIATPAAKAASIFTDSILYGEETCINGSPSFYRTLSSAVHLDLTVKMQGMMGLILSNEHEFNRFEETLIDMADALRMLMLHEPANYIDKLVASKTSNKAILIKAFSQLDMFFQKFIVNGEFTLDWEDLSPSELAAEDTQKPADSEKWDKAQSLFKVFASNPCPETSDPILSTLHDLQPNNRSIPIRQLAKLIAKVFESVSSGKLNPHPTLCKAILLTFKTFRNESISTEPDDIKIQQAASMLVETVRVNSRLNSEQQGNIKNPEESSVQNESIKENKTIIIAEEITHLSETNPSSLEKAVSILCETHAERFWDFVRDNWKSISNPIHVSFWPSLERFGKLVELMTGESKFMDEIKISTDSKSLSQEMVLSLQWLSREIEERQRQHISTILPIIHAQLKLADEAFANGDIEKTRLLLKDHAFTLNDVGFFN